MANLPEIKLIKEKTAVYYDGRKNINSPDVLYEIGKQILRDYIEVDVSVPFRGFVLSNLYEVGKQILNDYMEFPSPFGVLFCLISINGYANAKLSPPSFRPLSGFCFV